MTMTTSPNTNKWLREAQEMLQAFRFFFFFQVMFFIVNKLLDTYL